MYHIGDIKAYLACPRRFIYAQQKDPGSIDYLNAKDDTTLIYARKLAVDRYFKGQKNDVPKRFLEAYKTYDWFIKPRLEADGLRIKVPIIHKTENGVDIYFTFWGIYPRVDDLIYYRLQLAVIQRNGLRIGRIYVIRLNPDYVYDGKNYDYDKLFIVDEFLYNRKNKAVYPLMDLLKHPLDLKALIQELTNVSIKDYPPLKKRRCLRPKRCPFYDDCFKEAKVDNSILTLADGNLKYRLYAKGLRYLKEVDLNMTKLEKMSYAQVMADKNGGLYLDHKALSSFMAGLSKRPISFIDFEWDRYLIPPYEKMRPFDPLCFEFALYVLDADGQMHEYSFIQKGDCRKAFIQELLACLPKEGPILAYNAGGAEVLRIGELAQQNTDFASSLMALTERFVDLSWPFVQGMVYHTSMAGEFSLKRLVSLFSDYSYKDLAIHDGMEAVINYRNMEDAKKAGDLKKYCRLDAYGLYLIYSWLANLINRP